MFSRLNCLIEFPGCLIRYLCTVILLFISVNVTGQEPDKDSLFLSTEYHPISVTYYRGLVPESDMQPGGAIDKLGDKYIAVTGAGAFFQVNWSSNDGSIATVKLLIGAPHDAAAFDSYADPVVNRQFFRVIDIVSRKTEAGWQLFAGHHDWLRDKECLVMRVSAIQLDNRLQPVNGADSWERIYDTTPCMTLDTGNRGRIFAGHESGGRLAWFDEDHLLFTTGDQEHDGWNQPGSFSQSDEHMYGKTILIDINNKTGKMYSKGHRNPQGLFIDGDKNIWVTEHGPRGGDELNLVEEGKNYGWPYVTYGTDYGRYFWPPAGKVGDHSGYEQPVYAFVPSIATSNLIRLGDTQFEHWKGNLLIASLSNRSLFRLALDDKRVVYAEPIAINSRIRDLIVGPGGEIWAWGERGDLVSLTVAGSQHSGALAFQVCAGCHATGVTSGGLAPTLYQIVGRTMATRTDYVYSDSFKQLDGTWTEELLDEFLRDPTAFAPGTTMNTIKITDPEERRAIIDYLRDTVNTFR